MKKFLLTLALFTPTLYGASLGGSGASSEISLLTPSLHGAASAGCGGASTYKYEASAVTADGVGDIEHASRILKLLPRGLSLSEATLTAKGTITSYNPEKYLLTIVDRPASVAIAYRPHIDYIYTQEVEMPTVIFSEYDRFGFNQYYPTNRIILPLGLRYGLGYMKPELPIDPKTTQAELYGALSEKWKTLIYGESGIENTVLVLGYGSFEPGVLKAFAQSPYAHGKRILFFMKSRNGTVDTSLAGILGDLATVITTAEFVPTPDWHILQQLADATIATGDSSASDSFYFRSLPFWDCHKPFEANSWLRMAFLFERTGDMSNEKPNPEDIGASTNPIVQYIKKLKRMDGASSKEELADFVRSIDADFMTEWRRFCTYIEDHYTLTSEKLAALLDVGTKIVLGENPDFRAYSGILKAATIALLEKLSDVHEGYRLVPKEARADSSWKE